MSQGAIVDANVRAMWRFDEAAGEVFADAIDSSIGGTYGMEPISGSGGKMVRFKPGLITSECGVLLFDAANPCAWKINGRESDLQLRQSLQGSWTLEFWITRLASPDAQNVFAHALDANDSNPLAGDPAGFILLMLQFNIDGNPWATWTKPGDGSFGGFVDGFIDAPIGVRCHFAIRKERLGDPTTCTLSYFKNGVISQVQNGIENCSQDVAAGEDGSWWVGAGPPSYIWPLLGALDDVRLSFVKRSDAEILETYNRGIAGGAPVTNPVVSNFSPAVSSAVSKAEAITFDVTSADLSRVIVAVNFPGYKLYEVAHDGDAFSPIYPEAVGNTRVPISGGYRYTILRKEGWPASPRIVPMAFDTSGGVNPISSVTYAWTLV